MIHVAECIDDGDLGPRGEFVNGGLQEGAGDDGVGPAVEIAGDVLNRFAIADGADGDNGVAAELLDGELEGEARAE